MTKPRLYLPNRLNQWFGSARTVKVCLMDPLSDVLDLSRVRGALMVSVRACAPWGLDLPQWPGAAFHAITSGTAWLRVDGSEPLQLMPGDVFLLPAGARHRLSYEPRCSCVPFYTAAKERLI